MKRFQTIAIWAFVLVFFSFAEQKVLCSVRCAPLLDDTLTLRQNNFFGFSIDATIGDATLLQILPAFDFYYRYSFSPCWSAQISFSYTGEASLQRMTTAGQFASMFTDISKSNMAGVTALYSPNDFWNIGLGAFVRHRTYAYFYADFPFLQDTWTQYLLDYRIGIQTLVEYKIASFAPVEIFLKGQFLYFLPAFAGDAFIGNEDFYNFPANPDIKPLGYPSTVANYFSLAIPSPPFMTSVGISVCIGF